MDAGKCRNDYDMTGPEVSNRPLPPTSRAMPASDAKLARRAAGRDERAFAAIFSRYHQQLYRFCLSIVGNREDARDALQNTMVKALQALPGEERRIQLKPWLYRVAHNESIDLLRRRRELVGFDPDLAAPSDGLAETAARRDRLRQLLRDLAELPERQRAALVMRELGGLGFDQIGEAFDTSPAVARQTVYEARLSLRGLEKGREMSCEEVMHRLSNADGRVIRRRSIQAHLRACPDCRAFAAAIEARRHDLAALAPLPAVASAGIVHAILGGAPGAASGAAGAATVAAGAGKAVTAGLVAKSAATFAVVATIGVSAADRSGLIHVYMPGSSRDASSARQLTPAGGATTEGSRSTAPGSPSPATGDGKDVGDGKAAGAASNDGGKGGGAGEAAPTSGAGAGKAAPTSGGAGHGRNAPGALPAASGHGQETAAAHNAGSTAHPGRGAAHAHPTRHGSGRRHSGGHPKPKGGAHSHAGTGAPPKISHSPPPGEGVTQPAEKSPSRAEQSSAPAAKGA